MWAGSQRRIRDAQWPHVERFTASLPLRLFRDAKLLEYDLALRYSDTGDFRDIFLGADQFPILSLGGWLLEDLNVPADATREEAERRLFLVALLLAAQAHTLDALRDPSSFADDGRFALAAHFSLRAVRELAQCIPPDSPFWEQHDRISVDNVEQLLVQREGQPYAGWVGEEPGTYLHGRWSVPARVLALAAGHVAGAGEVAQRIGLVLERLAVAFQIRDDVESLHRDLEHGRITYPIAVVAAAAGLPLRPMPHPRQLLGALVATGSLPRILADAAARVDGCRREAEELELPTVSAYLAAASAHFIESAGRADPTMVPAAGARQAAPLFRRFSSTVATAVDMAARYLLSDRSFRESWETHREGLLDAAEVVSRYPAGLILEILHGRGHDVGAEIEDFLAWTAANGFRYYEHAWSDPDSDTLGVFLRLRAQIDAADGHDDDLRPILGCLVRQVRARGAVPVWITDCHPAAADRPPILALGEGCGTVSAHLLIGLATLPPGRFTETLGTGAGQLLGRIAEVGLGANVNYPPTYALAVFFRLLARLEAAGAGSRLASNIAAASERLASELEARIRAANATPQEAALAAIACGDAGRPELIDASWVSRILKAQRSDGGWNGEPFAAAPNRGGWVSWYSSSLLTSALCYEALARARPR